MQSQPESSLSVDETALIPDQAGNVYYPSTIDGYWCQRAMDRTVILFQYPHPSLAELSVATASLEELDAANETYFNPTRDVDRLTYTETSGRVDDGTPTGDTVTMFDVQVSNNLDLSDLIPVHTYTRGPTKQESLADTRHLERAEQKLAEDTVNSHLSRRKAGNARAQQRVRDRKREADRKRKATVSIVV